MRQARMVGFGFLAAGCLAALASCGFFGRPKTDPRAGASSFPSNAGSFTAEQWLSLSLSFYQDKRYVEAIAAAQTAAYLKPDYAEAYNNVGAAYGALHIWDAAIQADVQALRLRPGFALARGNLAWAMEQKRIGAR